jgi:hypothetical protein
MGFLVAFKATDGSAHGVGSFYHRPAERRTRIIDGFGRFRLIIAANKARRLQAEASVEDFLHEQGLSRRQVGS